LDQMSDWIARHKRGGHLGMGRKAATASHECLMLLLSLYGEGKRGEEASYMPYHKKRRRRKHKLTGRVRNAKRGERLDLKVSPHPTEGKRGRLIACGSKEPASLWMVS